MARQTTSQHAWRTEQTGGHAGRTSFSQVEKSMQSHPAKIVRADETDAAAIITILSTGFLNDPVSRWLFPDDDARERLHPEFFGPIVQMALEDGEIYTTEDRSGTALWLPVTAHHEDQPGLGELYEPILGADYAKRIAAFDERSTDNHPDHEYHFYLPFIAVRPQFFDQGIGTALLRDRLAALDSQGLPTYLEASNRDSARLYERLGYKRLDRTTDMPGGPSLYPMWRNPA
jgi:ribosomal protein S18 acetylase RimI-like enzyme